MSRKEPLAPPPFALMLMSDAVLRRGWQTGAAEVSEVRSILKARSEKSLVSVLPTFGNAAFAVPVVVEHLLNPIDRLLNAAVRVGRDLVGQVNGIGVCGREQLGDFFASVDGGVRSPSRLRLWRCIPRGCATAPSSVA